jgi:uncharacterized protein
MDANQRFEKIVAFVEQFRGGRTSPALDYRWKHTLRVANYGRQIAETEQANIEQVVAACLLHDLARFDAVDHGIEHGRVGARLARPFLTELGYSPAEVDNICFAIAAHVDDQADFEHPFTLEAKVVNDADNIDRFSTYRILLHFQDCLDDYPQLIAKASQRVGRLKTIQSQNFMATPTGERLFKRQLEMQIEFMERLIADSQISILPQIKE